MQGADIVLVPAGVARNHGTMKMNDLFNANCRIVATVAAAAAKVLPEFACCSLPPRCAPAP